jgi:hypothetical protein
MKENGGGLAASARWGLKRLKKRKEEEERKEEGRRGQYISEGSGLFRLKIFS